MRKWKKELKRQGFLEIEEPNADVVWWKRIELEEGVRAIDEKILFNGDKLEGSIMMVSEWDLESGVVVNSNVVELSYEIIEALALRNSEEK